LVDFRGCPVIPVLVNRGRHVFPHQAIGWVRISPGGGKPSGRRQAAPGRGGDPGPARCAQAKRRARSAAAVRRPLHRERDAALRRREGRDDNDRGQAYRPAPAVREALAGQLLRIGDRRPPGRSQVRISGRARHLSDRAASDHGSGLGSRRGEVAGRLFNRRHGADQPASPVPGDVLAGRGTRGPKGPRPGAPHQQGSDRGAPVCQAPQPLQRCRAGDLRYDQPLFRGRRRQGARPAWPFQRPSPRSASNGCRRRHRRGRSTDLQRDVAGQYRRRDDTDTGRYQAAGAFRAHRVCIIADRGMVSAKTIATLEANGIEYIPGVRERRSIQVAAVLADNTPFVSMTIPKANGRGTLDLQVKEVVRKVKAGQGNTRRCRYIVCYNEAEARNDAAAREATLAGLDKALRQGDKSMVGNKGFRRFLKTADNSHFAIDPERVAAAARFDGIYVIRTNARISPLAVALRYRQRWIVEDIVRTAKSIIDTRPIFHQRDDTIRG